LGRSLAWGNLARAQRTTPAMGLTIDAFLRLAARYVQYTLHMANPFQFDRQWQDAIHSKAIKVYVRLAKAVRRRQRGRDGSKNVPVIMNIEFMTACDYLGLV
jgi:hypothetical protein